MANLLSDHIFDVMHEIAKDTDKYFNAKDKIYVYQLPYEELTTALVDELEDGIVCQFEPGHLRVVIDEWNFDEFLEAREDTKDEGAEDE